MARHEAGFVLTKTPLRITFAGGGTDTPAYYKEHGPGAVVDAAIGHYIYVAAGNNFYPDEIRVSYSMTENALKSVDDIRHPTVREAMKLLRVEGGIQIVSITEIPSKGTGLGSSSSFLVGVLNALHNRKGQKVAPRQLAEEACLIERERLKEPGGLQDQYIAAYGGIKYMEFDSDGRVSLSDIRINYESMLELQSQIMLFYTGIERSSTRIHATQALGVQKNLEQYNRMRGLAAEARDAIEAGDWEAVGGILHKGWLIKRRLAGGISNTRIDGWYEMARKGGALGGKILGAGGGGFLMLFTPREKQAGVRRALRGLREIPVRFETMGSTVVYEC